MSWAGDVRHADEAIFICPISLQALDATMDTDSVEISVVDPLSL